MLTMELANSIELTAAYNKSIGILGVLIWYKKILYDLFIYFILFGYINLLYSKGKPYK